MRTYFAQRSCLDLFPGKLWCAPARLYTQMIYDTLSKLYARFVHHLVRAPAGYPSFDLDGKNKLRPDVSQFRSGSDVFKWAVEVAQGRAEQFRLRHNCFMMQIHGLWEVFWLPLAVGLHMSSLLHPLKSYHLGCFSGFSAIPRTFEFGHVVIEVHHGRMSHPLEPDKGWPCNFCGFPVPSLFRKRCGSCQVACYCSKLCCELDWPYHKQHCRAGDQMRQDALHEAACDYIVSHLSSSSASAT